MTTPVNPAPTTSPTPAAPSGGHIRSPRVQHAEGEAIQSAVVGAFEALRTQIASWMLDYIPNAHTLTADKICKILPLLAIAFRIATPAGMVWDTLDDLATDIAQALKEEAARRVTARASAATPATSAAVPANDPAKHRARFMVHAVAVLAQPDFDDLIVWHDALNDDDKDRLSVLASGASDVKLDALVRQKPAALSVMVSRVKLPAKPKTFLEFRQEVAADAVLVLLINGFLTAKAVDAARFWKAVEKAYGGQIKDKADLTNLMALGHDAVYSTLNLAPGPLEVFSTQLDASLTTSGLVQASKDGLTWAQQLLKDALK